MKLKVILGILILTNFAYGGREFFTLSPIEKLNEFKKLLSKIKTQLEYGVSPGNYVELSYEKRIILFRDFYGLFNAFENAEDSLGRLLEKNNKFLKEISDNFWTSKKYIDRAFKRTIEKQNKILDLQE